MYVTVENFQSNSVYTTEENAAWPLDSTPMVVFGVTNFKFGTTWFQNSHPLVF